MLRKYQNRDFKSLSKPELVALQAEVHSEYLIVAASCSEHARRAAEIVHTINGTSSLNAEFGPFSMIRTFDRGVTTHHKNAHTSTPKHWISDPTRQIVTYVDSQYILDPLNFADHPEYPKLWRIGRKIAKWTVWSNGLLQHSFALAMDTTVPD